MSAADAFIVALFGASGQGKSATIKQFLAARKPARVMLWDTMDEYREFAGSVDSLAGVVDRIRAGPAFALRYVPRGDGDALAEKFDTFCAIAFAAGEVVLIVEELQRVTRPAWAPAAWSDCTLRGRHRGVRIIGAAQRPAAVDKNFFSNATAVRSFRLNFADDVACMANVLGVARERISGLPRLHFVERDMQAGLVSDGALEFPTPGGSGGAPVAPKRKKRGRPRGR